MFASGLIAARRSAVSLSRHALSVVRSRSAVSLATPVPISTSVSHSHSIPTRMFSSSSKIDNTINSNNNNNGNSSTIDTDVNEEEAPRMDPEDLARVSEEIDALVNELVSSTEPDAADKGFSLVYQLAAENIEEIVTLPGVSKLARFVAESDIESGEHKDRGTVLLSLIVARSGDVEAAKKVLSDFVALGSGEPEDPYRSAVVLGNLASMEKRTGASSDVWRPLLEEACRKDPNLPVVLVELVSSAEEGENPLLDVIQEHGPRAYRPMLMHANMMIRAAASMDDAAKDDIEKLNREALNLVRFSVHGAIDAGNREHLTEVSSVLASNDLFVELEELVMPVYEVTKDDPSIAQAVIVARLSRGETDSAEKLLNELIEKLPAEFTEVNAKAIGAHRAEIESQRSKQG